MVKFFLVLLLSCVYSFAQDITVTPHATSLTDTLNSEMIFSATVTNVSQSIQDIFVVRSINNLPDNWFSALCFDACFPNEYDSIATTSYFNSSSLAPNESREIAVHVFAFMNTGVGQVQLQVGTFRSTERITLDFTATVNVSSVKDNELRDFAILTNYPNPFNPSTKIVFTLEEPSEVNIKIFNYLGVELKELYKGYLNSGIHNVDFSAENLSSGVYFYKISAAKNNSIGKMILEK